MQLLRVQSLFPFTEGEDQVSLLWLNKRLRKIKKELQPMEACAVCGFRADHWGARLGAIAVTMSDLVQDLMDDLKASLTG